MDYNVNDFNFVRIKKQDEIKVFLYLVTVFYGSLFTSEDGKSVVAVRTDGAKYAWGGEYGPKPENIE